MCAGVPVCMVTDMNCASALRVALREAGQRSPGVIALPVQCPDPEMGSLVSSILSDWESPDSGGAPVSHVLAVERAGPAADGRVYNMSKQDITCYNAPLHLLYGRHGSRHRVAIGDGGNELGMGLVPRNLLENVRHGTHIACDIPCETLVVSGVSNWGVWSLMGALAVLKKSWKPCLVESISEEVSLRVLKKTVAEGPAVDGVTGKRTFSVDGLPWQEHAKVLDEIRNIVSE
ncbi:unnamed protein product [Ostreobium quekettii]|uniref:D-glutamate cyclase-like C-terminal domain-containing protein n=1 Tax=Ostreobium quekettii TaxID=121088 RepID=A0A8S1JDM4_9CHLO|nr:unnamed protein product [Ostreobium quekettii]|eukprot:evm.model.scf_137.3 EVM.evm.TU.scf_137.3   scf_137:22370-23065(-)